MKHPEHHFFEFTPETLKAWCAERGMKPFRTKQILEWVYEKGIVDPTMSAPRRSGRKKRRSITVCAWRSSGRTCRTRTRPARLSA